MYNKIYMVKRYYKIFPDEKFNECVLMSKDVSDDFEEFVDKIYFDKITKALKYIYLCSGFDEEDIVYLPKFIDPFFDWCRLELEVEYER